MVRFDDDLIFFRPFLIKQKRSNKKSFETFFKKQAMPKRNKIEFKKSLARSAKTLDFRPNGQGGNDKFKR